MQSQNNKSRDDLHTGYNHTELRRDDSRESQDAMRH